MEQYKLRGQTYSAWSKMQCSDKRPHAPHSWSSEVTVYGPYFCEGIHTTCPCVVKCGHPIDYHFVRSHENGLVAICLQCHIELTAELKELREFVGAMNPGSEICFKGVVFHLCLDGKWRSDMARSGTSGNMRYVHQGYDTALDAWRKMNAGEGE